MKHILRLWILVFLGAAVAIGLVLFWESNANQAVTPMFKVPWIAAPWQAVGSPWPLSLALLVAFFAGSMLTLLGASLAAFSFMVRSARYRKEIRNLKREVESLRVSDLDEDLNELAFGEDEDDTLLGSTRASAPTPPVSAGAVSSFDENGDTGVSYSGILSGDLEEGPEHSTREAEAD